MIKANEMSRITEQKLWLDAKVKAGSEEGGDAVGCVTLLAN